MIKKLLFVVGIALLFVPAVSSTAVVAAGAEPNCHGLVCW